MGAPPAFHFSAVIMQKPHNCDPSRSPQLKEFMFSLRPVKKNSPPGSRSSFKANRPMWKTHCHHATSEADPRSCWKVDILDVRGFYLTAWYSILPRRLEWMRTSGRCVFMNRCVFVYIMTQNPLGLCQIFSIWIPPYKSPQWSHSARGAADTLCQC